MIPLLPILITLLWDAPTTYTNDAPLEHVDYYKVFKKPLGSKRATSVKITDPTIKIEICNETEFWVTAVAGGKESGKSNVLKVSVKAEVE